MKDVSNYYDNMNIRMVVDTFARIAQGITEIYHEVLMVMKFLQTRPQIKNMNNKYYDLYCTVIKSWNGRKILDDQYENKKKWL